MKSFIRIFVALLAVTLFACSNARAAAKVTFYHHDALGSVIATSDEDGEIHINEEYQPYGEKIYQSQDFSGGSDDWFTGKNYSRELDLTYFGARWYDAKQGRFLSMDPAPVVLGNVHSFNRYVYAYNNPYKYVDPDGREAFFAFTPVVIPGDMNATVGVSKQINRGAAAGGLVGLATLILGPKELTQEAISEVTGVDIPIPSLRKLVTKGGDRLVIGRGRDLAKTGALKEGEKKLSWRPTGTVKSEWKTNSGLLRQEMSKGKPIRDASPGNDKGMYLNAERNLLGDRGWTFDSKTNYWSPPK